MSNGKVGSMKTKVGPINGYGESRWGQVQGNLHVAAETGHGYM